jgi:hypothetical protein
MKLLALLISLTALTVPLSSADSPLACPDGFSPRAGASVPPPDSGSESPTRAEYFENITIVSVNPLTLQVERVVLWSDEAAPDFRIGLDTDRDSQVEKHEADRFMSDVSSQDPLGLKRSFDSRVTLEGNQRGAGRTGSVGFFGLEGSTTSMASAGMRQVGYLNWTSAGTVEFRPSSERAWQVTIQSSVPLQATGFPDSCQRADGKALTFKEPAGRWREAPWFGKLSFQASESTGVTENRASPLWSFGLGCAVLLLAGRVRRTP